ncbi:hypothetical protein RBE51_21595 [Pseudomonas taiwanensis]|uniref:hypothetical protein n=1 Tax=Pseudomonas taiwanensis TaxID=470150 RepID=UPI0028DE281C|nr:hypothetical protein [Pseudomonas taiwanensis]MDT8925394.1 hypothetical protein [Pseudomonas taiwanensis]
MKFCMTIETYCHNPFSVEQVNAIRAYVSKRQEENKRADRVYGAIALVSSITLLVFALAGSLSGLGFSLGFLAVLATILLYVTGEPKAYECIHLVIHGINMATYETFADYIALVDDTLIKSPLARILVSNIRSQKRNIMQFEKDLIDKLSSA